MSTPVFRFAPSPNGLLHLGHAYSALLDHALARAVGGRFLVRLEDIDGTRCREDHVRAILDDLAWLGISWDEEPMRQSTRFAAYGRALDRLAALGLLYESRASRGEIRARVAAAEAAGESWPRDPDGAPFPPPEEREGRRGAISREAPALRLDTAAAVVLAGPLSWREVGEGPAGEHGIVVADPLAWGDPVVARKETPTSYHLAVVVDDAAQGVSHVVRGRDLFAATGVHRLLQRLLDLPEPVYLHHDLVTDAGGRKLAKSSGDTALQALRAAGASADDVRRSIGWEAVEARLPALRRALIASR